MKKCNQCGRCCAEEVCAIGREAFKTDIPPCPGIIFKDDKNWCIFVLFESVLPQTDRLLSKALGIGKGCDGYPKKVVKPEKINDSTYSEILQKISYSA